MALKALGIDLVLGLPDAMRENLRRCAKIYESEDHDHTVS